MDKSGKLYVKAMNKYNDGYIDKALALCEKSISLNITNAAALNLRGILYYLKGDLENAKKMWNINYKRNNDKISKKYIKDSARDKEKLQLYINALDLVKRFNISDALEQLNKCGSSHFNFINVNNLISLCYIKQGEYDKALPHIVDVLKTDKKNAAAMMNKKTIIEYGNLKPKINHKKILIVTVAIVLAIVVILISKEYMYKLKNSSILGIGKAEKNIHVEKQTNPITKENPIENKAIENKPIEKSEFPKEKFEEAINTSNMEQIILYVNKWKGKELEINNKLLILKGEEIIKKEGVLYFYKKGVAYMDDKKLIEAEKYFLYALPYSKDSYLNEHIIYMLALSYKSGSDFQNAIIYYELSLKQFPKGSYTQEVLYNLILINKDIDMVRAKEYAEKLITQFPDSQYYNNVVKNILK